jgi:AcrR family transcriptional regulator
MMQLVRDEHDLVAEIYQISNASLKTRAGVTRPFEFTRERILKTAARLFAERGYDATNIRTLAAKARVNQAAISNHFKSKDGLYREVLREAIHALTKHQLSHAQETQAMPRERALGEFI